MVRAVSGVARRRRAKKILKRAKGFYGGRHRLLRTAKEAVKRALAYSYFGRKIKKRDYRSLWITRISAMCDQLGISYSKFIGALKKAKIELNRKMLSEIAIHNPEDFKQLVELAKQKM